MQRKQKLYIAIKGGRADLSEQMVKVDELHRLAGKTPMAFVLCDLRYRLLVESFSIQDLIDKAAGDEDRLLQMIDDEAHRYAHQVWILDITGPQFISDPHMVDIMWAKIATYFRPSVDAAFNAAAAGK